MEPEIKIDCASEDRQQYSLTDPTLQKQELMDEY
jgi:hypothetical protein